MNLDKIFNFSILHSWIHDETTFVQFADPKQS